MCEHGWRGSAGALEAGSWKLEARRATPVARSCGRGGAVGARQVRRRGRGTCCTTATICRTHAAARPARLAIERAGGPGRIPAALLSVGRAASAHRRSGTPVRRRGAGSGAAAGGERAGGTRWGGRGDGVRGAADPVGEPGEPARVAALSAPRAGRGRRAGSLTPSIGIAPFRATTARPGGPARCQHRDAPRDPPHRGRRVFRAPCGSAVARLRLERPAPRSSAASSRPPGNRRLLRDRLSGFECSPAGNTRARPHRPCRIHPARRDFGLILPIGAWCSARHAGPRLSFRRGSSRRRQPSRCNSQADLPTSARCRGNRRRAGLHLEITESVAMDDAAANPFFSTKSPASNSRSTMAPATLPELPPPLPIDALKIDQSFVRRRQRPRGGRNRPLDRWPTRCASRSSPKVWGEHLAYLRGPAATGFRGAGCADRGGLLK